MCVENGFEKIGEFIPHTASALPEVVTEFRLVTTEEYPSVLEFIQRSESFQSSFGLLDMGWRWARLAEVHLNDALSHNQIWWWRGDQGCLGFWLDEEDEDNRPQILFVACEMDRLGEMLLDFRKLAAQLGHNMVAWTAPHDHLANAALGKAGFERSWEHSIFVFELER